MWIGSLGVERNHDKWKKRHCEAANKTRAEDAPSIIRRPQRPCSRHQTNHTATTLSHKRAHDPSVRCSASLARCNRRQRKVVARHGLADRARARRKEGYQADGVSMPLRCVADLSEWQRHPPLGQQGSCQPRLAGLAGIQAKSMHGPGCMDLAARTQAKRPAGSSRPTIRPAAASSNMQQTFSLFAKMRWVVRDHHRHSGVVVAGY